MNPDSDNNRQSIPPNRALKFLRWFCREDYLEEIEGDLFEIFEIQSEESPKKARRRFTWSVIRYFRPEFMKSFKSHNRLNTVAMISNYLKITFRNQKKDLTYSSINIIGLAIGIACTILITLWVQYEKSFDAFHENKDRVFWTVRKYINPNGSIDYSPVTVLPMAEALITEFPEIASATRFNDAFGEFPIKYKDKVISVSGSPTDQAFFTIFSFPFVAGNMQEALKNPNSIVFSQSTARAFFGDENPIGQSVQFELWGIWWDFIVTGVFEDIPANSHFKFDMLFPISFMKDLGWNENNWADGCVKTYILTNPGINQHLLTKKIENINIDHNADVKALIDLHPLSKIHLYNLEGNGRIIYIYIFSTIAVFILIISCINFVNLTTAGSEKRFKEVGIRKVMGAFRIQIASQFLIESVLSSLNAFIIAVGIIYFAIPFFNQLTTSEIDFWSSGTTLTTFILISLFVGIASGIYPSIILSSPSPIKLFKNSKYSRAVDLFPSSRKVLTGFQFMLSIILIVGVFTIHEQLSFMVNKPLGFNKDHVLKLTLRSGLRDFKKYQTIKNELLSYPEIVSMTASNSNFTNWQYTANERDIFWEGKQPDDKIEFEVNSVDVDYLQTFNMEMAQGRFFSNEFDTDQKKAIVLNEAAIEALGIEDPIGKRFDYHGKRQIVGVIKDFNFFSLHHSIKPLMLIMEEYNHSLYIKIRGNDIDQTIQHIGKVISSHVPDYPFDYSFMDDDLMKMYQFEQSAESVLVVFAILAVFVSCLGILGLTVFVTERRTKEIAIRKVLGSSVIRVLALLTKEFIYPILVAFVLATPIALFILNLWLKKFAYRVDIQWYTLVLAGLLVTFITMITIGYKTIQAAKTNPVNSLRNE